MNDYHGIDYFHRALYSHSILAMQGALSSSIDSYAFSACLPVRLVRSLLYFAVNAKEEHLHSNSFANESTKYKMVASRGVILPKIVHMLTQRQSISLIEAGGNNPFQAAGNLLGTIQNIFFGNLLF